MSSQVKKVSDFAYAINPSDHTVILIKRGEVGFWPSPGMTAEAADAKNASMGLSYNERTAMEMGSMFGWDVPGARPYKDDGSPSYTKATSLVDEAKDRVQQFKRDVAGVKYVPEKKEALL